MFKSKEEEGLKIKSNFCTRSKIHAEKMIFWSSEATAVITDMIQLNCFSITTTSASRRFVL